jgi:hypothetical protein
LGRLVPLELRESLALRVLLVQLEAHLEKLPVETQEFIQVLAVAVAVTLNEVAMVVLELFTLGTRRKGRLTNGNS